MDIYEVATSSIMLLCNIIGIVSAVIFLITMIYYLQHRTLIILVTSNTVIAGLIANTIFASQAIYQMISDTPDPLCPLRGILLHSSTGLFFHTLCIQTIYRLFVTVYAQKRYLQSSRVISILIGIQWLISITFGIPILLMGGIVYQNDGRICQVSLHDIFGFMYLGTFIYLVPLPIIIIIYLSILKYMKRNVILAGVRQIKIEKNRQKREFRFTRRILILVVILFLTGFPYLLLFLVTNFGHLQAPFYGHRISFIFLSFGQGLVMVVNLFHTDEIRRAVLIKCCRQIQVQPVATIAYNRTVVECTLANKSS